MRKNLTDSILKSLKVFPENIMFLAIGTFILLIPIVATIGQYIDTGYFRKEVPVLLLYWPGSDFEIKIQVYVWLIISLMLGSYLAGIFYLCHKRTIGKVILFTIGFFIISILIRTLLSRIFGLQESALPDMKGKANSLILAQWHNPIWEEIVFRGIPLLLLLGSERYITKRRTLTGVLLYFIIPSFFLGLYHIPGHGLIRFFDTLVLSLGFSWLAFRYSFFAAIVMHCIADAMIVLSLDKITTIAPNEIPWILHYGPTLNTIWSFLILAFIILIPVIIISRTARGLRDQAV
jgi:hypothetical protein